VFPQFDGVPVVIPFSSVLLGNDDDKLSNGSYEALLTLINQNGAAIYTEETSVIVTSGIASILIGTGTRTSSTPLSAALFADLGVVEVEVLLDCNEMPQIAGYLGTNPYSLISETALSVADGSIVFEDLSGDLFENIVTEILSRIDEDEPDPENFVLKSGDTMTGNLVLLNANLVLSDGYLVDGVDVSSLATTTAELSATAANLSTAVSSLAGTVSGISASVDSLQNHVSVLDTTLADLDSIYATDNELVTGLSGKLSVFGGTIQGGITIANADLNLSDEQKIIFDNDSDTFITKSTSTDLMFSNNGRTRIGC